MCVSQGEPCLLTYQRARHSFTFARMAAGCWYALFALCVYFTDVQGLLFKNRKTYAEDEAKDYMFGGNGGTAVIDVGLGEKLIVLKEKLYTCRDLEITASSVKCPSGYDKFEVKNSRDICYALRYSILDDNMGRKYCIPPDDQPVNFVMENNQMTCRASSRNLNVTIISEESFYRLCRRRIADPIKVYYFAKNRNNMPIIRADSIECSHYTCVFLTYREVDRKSGGSALSTGQPVKGQPGYGTVPGTPGYGTVPGTPGYSGQTSPYGAAAPGANYGNQSPYAAAPGYRTPESDDFSSDTETDASSLIEKTVNKVERKQILDNTDTLMVIKPAVIKQIADIPAGDAPEQVSAADLPADSTKTSDEASENNQRSPSS